MAVAIKAAVRLRTCILLGAGRRTLCTAAKPQGLMFTALGNPSQLGLKSIHHPDQAVYNGKTFPLVLIPRPSHAEERTVSEWCQYVSTYSTLLRNLLANYAAVLFRGLPLEEPADFDMFSKSFGLTHFPYTGGNAPRHGVTGNVFTANEAPAEQFIPYHHEMAYQHAHPNYVFLYCNQVALQGGETPLVHSCAVYERMERLFPAVVKKMWEEGVLYERILPEEDDVDVYIGRGWKSTFNTDSRDEAELICTKLRHACEWLPDGCMKITSKLPAFGRDPVSGKPTWFNHIINFKLFNFPEDQFGPRRVAYLGSGEKFSKEFMEGLISVVDELAVSIPWEKGDVMLTNNNLAMHARRPFTPPRSVMAVLCS